MPLRIILVGTGNQGAAWCREFLPPNEVDGTVELVAAVDADAEALEGGRNLLGLPEDRCQASARKAVVRFL